MPLLLDRYFLTVRKGPSRNYKPHLEVASEQETSTLTTQSPGLATYMICLKSGTEPPNYIFGELFLPPLHQM